MAENENSKLTIEQSLEQLEEILQKMEDEETGLEESFRLYEQGLKLVKSAGESIDRVEKQIRILSEEE